MKEKNVILEMFHSVYDFEDDVVIKIDLIILIIL